MNQKMWQKLITKDWRVILLLDNSEKYYNFTVCNHAYVRDLDYFNFSFIGKTNNGAYKGSSISINKQLSKAQILEELDESIKELLKDPKYDLKPSKKMLEFASNQGN